MHPQIYNLSHHSLALLPNQLHVFIHTRLVSSSSSADSDSFRFPYPTQPRPTPHQIFHLPLGASQRDIKSRYYDLVRAHHPDSPSCRALPQSVRHARFQSITSAYDVLRGHSSAPAHWNPRSDDDVYMEEVRRRRRAHSSNYWREAHPGWGRQGFGYAQNWAAPPSGDERWKDKLIIVVGIVTLAAGLAPVLFLSSAMERQHLSAAANLRQARQEAREYREERRKYIKQRIRKQRELNVTSGSDMGSRSSSLELRAERASTSK